MGDEIRTHLREHRCRCGATAFAAEDFTGEPRCTSCGQADAGVTSAGGRGTVGWHPTVGYGSIGLREQPGGPVPDPPTPAPRPVSSGGWEIGRAGGQVTGRAQFNTDRTRRYFLSRRWVFDMAAPDAGVLTWMMLNPSTAGAAEDDATIRKCVGYAKRWGYGAIRVINLFDLILTDSSMLNHPGFWHTMNSAANDQVWRYWLAPAEVPGWSRPPDVIVAWGAKGSLLSRDQWAAQQLVRAGVEPTCLGLTADGQPLHPGRTSYDLERSPWKVL